MRATVCLRNTVWSLLVVLTLPTLEPGSLAATPPIWTLQLDRRIDWFKASPSGNFLVGTDQEILGVAPDSGTVAWRIRPGRKSPPATCGPRDMHSISRSYPSVMPSPAS